MKKKQPAKATTPTPAYEAAPDWVNKTPDECDYELLMWDGDGKTVEQVDVTRTEYLMLKHVLAARRGYDVSKTDFATTERCGDLAGALEGAIISAREWAEEEREAAIEQRSNPKKA